MLFCSDSKLFQTFGSGFHRSRNKKDIFPLTRIEFEGYFFNAPKDSHAYLQGIFGDYMRLPDESKIVSHV